MNSPTGPHPPASTDAPHGVPVWNFGAGPALLPAPVLERAAGELTDWHGTGMSPMELSHRGKAFIEIANEAEDALRRLLAVPDGYRALFLQGGASLQFAAVPLNLLPAGGRAAYVDSGAWAEKAIAEARRYGEIDVVWSGESTAYTTLPDPDSLEVDETTGYLHLTSNETIGGVQWSRFPTVAQTVVADMSSDILSRPLDISQFGLIYAGAQKNIGPAGLTLVIVRDDLIGNARADTPSILDYRIQADADWMVNTPPTYAVYIAGLVFQWLLDLGGVPAIEARNEEKAALLYGAIDQSGFYVSPVEPSVRSRMNVPFRLADTSLEPAFLADADAAGLRELKGHRSVGGMRASIYNAMPLEGVQALVEFMADFERRHG